MTNGRTPTAYRHIELTEDGQAILADSQIKVKQLAAEHTAWGSGPEALVGAHHPLTLAQILSALAYYYDHKEQLDSEIQSDQERTDQQRALQQQQPSPALEKLRALKAAQSIGQTEL
ncbi:MAG: hypothetical protein H7Y22_19000 [Gemmatimonadaceae bacterium]|nr:hypothetical protein [Gloeobacterales cyanobacterium ES-bin-141]